MDTTQPLTINRIVIRSREANGGRAAIGPRPIRRAIRDGELRAIRVGSRLLVSPADFDEWLERRRVVAAPGAGREQARAAARQRVAARAAL